jgi:hypothetical protein
MDACHEYAPSQSHFRNALLPIDDQVVDIFAKSLIEVKFSKLRSMSGVLEVVIKGG